MLPVGNDSSSSSDSVGGWHDTAGQSPAPETRVVAMNRLNCCHDIKTHYGYIFILPLYCWWVISSCRDKKVSQTSRFTP